MLDHVPSSAPVSMRRYGVQLVLCMVGLAVASVAVSAMLRFQLPSAMGIIILMASLTIPANRFATHERRDMTSGEKARLGLWAAVGTVIPAAVIVPGLLIWAGLPLTLENAAMVLFGDLGFPVNAVLIVIAASAALAFLVTYLSAGFMTRGQLKALVRQESRPKS